MITRQRSLTIRRVVVGFDPCGESEALVETATRLASAIRAELHGLFVEEDHLLDLAGLPFARIVPRAGRRAEPLDLDRMRAALRREASACERALSTMAARARLEWSFGRARGQLSDELGAAVGAGDLIVVRAGGYGAGTLDEAIATARRVAAHAGGVVVVSTPARPMRGPVVVLDEDGPASLAALELAYRIAGAVREPLVVFVVAATTEDAERIMDNARRTLPDEARIAFYAIVGQAIPHLARRLSDLGPSLVVGDLESALFRNDETARLLIGAARAPVLLLRPLAEAA